jgi:mannose-6-phosphate isomerase-like protein (cupin superfamily)
LRGQSIHVDASVVVGDVDLAAIDEREEEIYLVLSGHGDMVVG